MEDDMVVDAVLWVILAAAIVFVACGCHYTRPAPKVSTDTYRDKIDHAA